VGTPCDLLLTNAHVLTMDDRFTAYRRGSVAIGGGSLLAIGDIATQYEPADTIDCLGRVVMPGKLELTPTMVRRLQAAYDGSPTISGWMSG
jgi:5-methylthioadenosine/S-adenosylhomocysteine deaminase